MLAVTPYSTHFVIQIVDVWLSLLERSIKLIFGFVIFSPALVYETNIIIIEISRTNYLVVNFIFSNFNFAIFVLHDLLLHRYWRYISLLSFQVVEPLPPNPYVNN